MRIVLCMPQDAAAALAADATRHGHEVVAVVAHSAALVTVLLDAGADLVIVAASPEHLDQEVVALCDARAVRLVAAVTHDAERRHAIGLGLFELVDVPALWPAFEQFAAGPVVSRPIRSTHGRVVAVWGPAGAPGRTTIAIGLATELALAGYSVALADVDTHSAAVAPALGLLDEAPGFAAACRLAASGSLDRREFERIGHYHRLGREGLWVLTGIGRPSRWPELGADRVAGVIASAREWVDVTVLDTSASLETDEEITSDLFAPRRNAATLTALRDADRIVAVGAADPVGMSRLLRAFGDLTAAVERADAPDVIDVVMNKVRSSAVGLGAAAQVARTLERFGGVDAAALIPWDLHGHDAAVLTGTTLAQAAPKSAARVALRRYVSDRLVPALGIRDSIVAPSGALAGAG